MCQHTYRKRRCQGATKKKKNIRPKKVNDHSVAFESLHTTIRRLSQDIHSSKSMDRQPRISAPESVRMMNFGPSVTEKECLGRGARSIQRWPTSSRRWMIY